MFVSTFNVMVQNLLLNSGDPTSKMLIKSKLIFILKSDIHYLKLISICYTSS